MMGAARVARCHSRDEGESRGQKNLIGRRTACRELGGA